jgi:hypothetical protein
MLALAFAADRVQRGVGAADEMEVIADDPSMRQLGADRLSVGVVGIDRDDLDRRPLARGQGTEVALNAAATASVEHLDHAPAIEIRDHGGQLATATVIRLIQRQPPRRRHGTQPSAAIAKRARDLIAAGLLLAGNLGMGAAAMHTFQQPPTEARGDALTGRQLGMRLGERASAALAVVAPFAPDQKRRPTRNGQIADAHPRAISSTSRSS